MHCKALPLVHTMLLLLTSNVLDLRPALVSTYLGFVSSALLPGLERLPTRTQLPTALRISVLLVSTTVSPYFALTPERDQKFLQTSMAHSTMEAYEDVRHLDHAGKIAALPALRNKRLPRPCFATRSKNVIFLYRSLHVPQKSWDRSADTLWHKSNR